MIKAINDRHKGVVFILWGGYAAKKGAKINKVWATTAAASCKQAARDHPLPSGHFDNEQREAERCPDALPAEQAPCDYRPAPVPAVSASRILWLQALLQDQRAAAQVK